MNIERLIELMPELEELNKKNNHIRINALIRHECQINEIHGIKLTELMNREKMFGLKLLVAEHELAEVDRIVNETPEFSKTQLNAMKKSELVALLLGEEPEEDEPQS